MTKKASLHLHYHTQGCNLLQSEVTTMAVNGLHVETDGPRISHQLLRSNHHHHCILSRSSYKMLRACWKGCCTVGCVSLDPAETGSALSTIVKCKAPVLHKHMQNFRVRSINWCSWGKGKGCGQKGTDLMLKIKLQYLQNKELNLLEVRFKLLLILFFK